MRSHANEQVNKRGFTQLIWSMLLLGVGGTDFILFGSVNIYLFTNLSRYQFGTLNLISDKSLAGGSFFSSSQFTFYIKT